ncbi:stathmin-3-like isoform X2 [Mizuhopecten yessoensis]|uniref:stathmin-3-like isoform X2 n=1 Tax=Mizuhopecten yessoensis TaxID=6573 RepID=UPI000B459AAC|nr:stathmin-3-like isoform X2 [Mizuhopecten yessoensis]
MTTACSNWLNIFSCMRHSVQKKPAIHPQVHPNKRAFDAIIVWKGKEGTKKSYGGVAYDYILKPAAMEVTNRPVSPPKDRPLTHDQIARKLREAEERRLSIEAQKVEFAAREKTKIQEVMSKSMEQEEQFARAAHAKLRRSMEITKENRKLQIMALQDKLRDHLARVEEVCKNSDSMAKDLNLKEKIDQKLEAKEENRKAQLQALLVRLKDHGKHIEDVCKASENINKAQEEKMINKMENALKNREEHLRALQDRLKEHERKIEEVRRNKLNLQITSSD